MILICCIKKIKKGDKKEKSKSKNRKDKTNAVGAEICNPGGAIGRREYPIKIGGDVKKMEKEKRKGEGVNTLSFRKRTCANKNLGGEKKKR